MTDQRTPEIPETNGALETNLSRTGATALEFRHRFSTTSLSPYGMSFWALILAACGGGGGGGGGPVASTTPEPSTTQTAQKSGHVYDGPVWRAGVYLDVNDNGELDRGTDHFVGETNEQGAFSGSAPQQHQGKRYIVDLNGAIDLGNDGAVGGTGENADRTLSGTWLAPEGASVVSAITHLIATGFTTPEQVQSAIPNFNPLHDNPYSLVVITPEKAIAFEKARAVLPALTKAVQDNRQAIEQNARDIATNRASIGDLKGEYRELESKFKKVLKGELVTSGDGFVSNAAPTGVALSRTTHSVDEGSTVSGALTRITITDDGLGTVTLRPLPQNSIFEYRPVVGERGVYELHLKSGVTLDQSKIGAQTVTIQATGNGVGDDPAAVTFTLTVRDIDNPTTGTVGITGTARENEVLTADVSNLNDADGKGTFSYVWKAGGVVIANGNNNKTLRLTDAEVGKVITVEVTHTDARGGAHPAIISTPTPPVANVPPPQPAPNLAPSLTITSPEQQTVVNETIGTNVTRRIDTGIGVVARDPEGNLRPLLIQSQSQQNGQWLTDDRFEIRNNRLSVKAGQQFDFEHTDNPNGVITLRITASDGTTEVQRQVTVQLTNVNDPTTGTIAITGAGGVALSPQLHTDTTLHVSETTPIADPDGIRSITYVWRDSANNQVGITGTSFTPASAGTYHVVAIVIDQLDGRQEIKSAPVDVTAPPPAIAAPSLTITDPPAVIDTPATDIFADVTGEFQSTGTGVKTYNVAGASTVNHSDFTHAVVKSYSVLWFNATTGAYKITYKSNAIDSLLSGQPENQYKDGYAVTVTVGGQTSGPGTLTVQLGSSTNDRPNAVDNSTSVDEGGTITGHNVRSNDSDAETLSNQLTITGIWIGDGTDGTAGIISHALQTQYGTLTLEANGSYTYVANRDVTATSVDDVFTYRIRDEHGTTATAKLTITVNDNPTLPPTTQPRPVVPQPDSVEIVFTAHSTMIGGASQPQDTGIRFTVSGEISSVHVTGTGRTTTAFSSENIGGNSYKILANRIYSFADGDTIEITVKARRSRDDTLFEKSLKFIVGDPQDGSVDFGPQILLGRENIDDTFKVDSTPSGRNQADKIRDFEAGHDEIRIGEPAPPQKGKVTYTCGMSTISGCG